MAQIRIDKKKAINKWSPVLENMGVAEERVEWMSEMAEFHSINENAYANSNVAGMGGVVSPNPSGLPGQTINGYADNGGIQGSGDVGQNLLPVAMKIAAQTIGLDLVAVKPSPGPKVDLVYIDFQYDDLRDDSEERPQVFKVSFEELDAIKVVIDTALTAAGITQTQGGLSGGRIYLDIDGGVAALTPGVPKLDAIAPGPNDTLEAKVEFLGYSRIDGLPIFKSYRQANVASTGSFVFNQNVNTFVPVVAMTAQFLEIGGVPVGNPNDVAIELVSALEDHIPGFSANWTSGNGAAGDYPMSRADDDSRYSGVIGPKISTKSVAIGTIEVSSALRRTEIEDIKANTGMDIVQKMESVLVNELSQTISKQIVAKIFEMGELNRASAPLRGVNSIFDLNTNYAGAGIVSGETTHAVQRKLITKIAHASNFIATEGRVGPAQYLVTNGGLAAAIQDIAGYTINPVKSKINGQGQLYPVGQIGDISVYVDPYMRYNDNRIVLGRKNNPDQPGVIFVPYLMAQSISLISEATFAPRILLRSRYAITEVGFFPQKQFMTIQVLDEAGLLN